MNRKSRSLGSMNSILDGLVAEAVKLHNVLPLTGSCNLRCLFCSHRRNPRGTRAYAFPRLEKEQLLPLVPFLDGERKIIIGESATRLREGEPLTHPHFFDLLEEIRRLHPAALLQVTTNGSLLDREKIRRLAALAPLEMVLSLNSSSPRGRQLLMSDPAPEAVLAGIERLAAHGIPFHGSIVALPYLVGRPDVTATARFLEQSGAQTVRLLLPGYTRLSRPPLVPPPGWQEDFYRLGEELREELAVPVTVEPPLIMDLLPIVAGITKHSPAARAGLGRGDIIRRVDNIEPSTRVEAFQLLYRVARPWLLVERNGRQLSLVLDKRAREAPGVVMDYDLDPAQVKRIRRLAAKGGETLMLVSPAALPRWQAAREAFNLEGLRLVAVASRFFGGSISCSGLLTVADYRHAVQPALKKGCPRRILVPAVSFDTCGLDMAGSHYSCLQEVTSLPVEVVR